MTYVSEQCRHLVPIALALLAASTALAAPPEVNIEETGDVVGMVVVPASEAEVREVVDDPVRTSSLSSDIVSIESSREGACDELTTRTRGLFRPFSFKSRRCPTETGWHETLVESDDFDDFETRWELREVEGGTEVVIRTRTKPRMAIPQSVVESNTRRSIGDLLEALVQNVVRRKK